jgi:hypothetical protein
MAKQDGSNSDVSIAGRIARWPASLSIKSRFVAARDRLAGNRVDQQSLPLEREAAIERAKAEQEVAIIKALGKRAIAKIAEDADFADRALSQYFGNIFAAQRNVEAVVAGAAEQLLLSPQGVEADNGPDALRDEFYDRFESYARAASTDELRQKWAALLAAEIRSPGTVSNKVMRIVDEADPVAGALFQEICAFRLGRWVFKNLIRPLSLLEQYGLVSSGLIFDPTGEQVAPFGKSTMGDGTEAWVLAKDGAGVAFPIDASFTYDLKTKTWTPLRRLAGAPAAPVYLLTAEGEAIASVFEYNPIASARKFAEAIRDVHGISGVELLTKDGEFLIPSPL